jgi:hypothetical protein
MKSKLNWRTFVGVLALGLCLSPLALAEEASPASTSPRAEDEVIVISGSRPRQTETAARADSHGPIGVMGDHMHESGEWMIGYRFAAMSMSGSVDNGTSVSPDWIVTNVPNPFSGMPMQPPTLRIVPTEMRMQMHTAGLMYGVRDWVTVTVAGSYLEKEMDAITYDGMMGTTQLGRFTTRTSGFGDTKVIGSFRLYRGDTAHVQLNTGLSLPTGSITERDEVLTPSGMTMNMRLPYGMQLGSGTYDLLPSITYTDHRGRIGWGMQYTGMVRLGENDEGYALGDSHQAGAWLSYQPAPWISASTRLTGRTQDAIDGRDVTIMGPAQGANPENYGGETVELSFGVNLVGQTGAIYGHRIAADFTVPLHSDLNGLQLEPDWRLVIGYQKTF